MGYFSKKRRSPSRESVDVTAWPNSERIPLALALSTASERGGAVAGNPSSDSLQEDAKGHLNRRSLGHLLDIAKIQINTEITKNPIKKIRTKEILF